jgi:CO dehydrogenase/acetyl-CoA synthase delta subunit
MMMHPAAVKALKGIIKQLLNGGSLKAAYEFSEWVSMKV